MSNWQKSFDESLLGLLKPNNIMSALQSIPALPSMESLLQSLPTLPSIPLIPSIETALLSAPAMPALPVPTVTFPALSSQISVIMDRVRQNDNIGLDSLARSYSFLLTHSFADEAIRIIVENVQRVVTFFDIGHLPFLSVNQQEYLMAHVDTSVRVVMGLGLLEVIPFVLNIILVKMIFNSIFKVGVLPTHSLTHSLTHCYKG